MNQNSHLEKLLKTATQVGQFFIPANSLGAHLGRAAQPLLVMNDDDTHKFSVYGSSIGLIHYGRSILVCSRHQLRDCNSRNVSLLRPDGSILVTSSGASTFDEGGHLLDSDAFDITAFNFSKPVSAYPDLGRGFFKFHEIPPETHRTNILAFILAGYPSAKQEYELEENNRFGFYKCILLAEIEGHPSDPALLKLKYLEPIQFNPDGLSGGPAFAIQLVGDTPRAFLAGMILRAGKSSCHILRSSFIWEFLESFGK